MAPAYRFVEACALLPMLFVPPNRDNAVFCTGPQAEALAADCLRWRDVKTVYLTSPPIRPVLPDPTKRPELKDKRIVVAQKPPLGSCSAVLTSPGEDPDAYISTLTPDGIVCVSRDVVTEVQPMLWHMRRLFPKHVTPWREFMPQELYGCLASPIGVPKRLRGIPGGAKRLNDGHVRAMMTFAADEVPMVFSGQSGKTDMIVKA